MSYHKLMMENHTLFSKMVFERLSGQELSAGQPKVLEYLIEHDGVAQKDIAEAVSYTHLTLPTICSV